MKVRGETSNVIDYMYNDEVIEGKLFVDAEEIDLNDFMTEGESAGGEGVFVVDKKMDFTIYPDVKKVVYDSYDLKQVVGKITLSDGVAALQEGKANALGGRINLDGIYDTSNPAKPLFDLRYQLDKLSFQKLVSASESFKLLAPFAKYMDGALNSTLVMSGPLKNDMLPDLTKVTASGYLETLKGVLTGFEPLEKVGEALGLSKLSNLSLDGTKNWFDVKDGIVILKPHDHHIDDMTFTLTGNHGLDQSIDYVVNAKIPRDKLSKDKVGKNLEYGMDFIEKEASSKGVKIELGDMIYLDIFLTGSVKSPKLRIIPVGSGGKTLQEVVKDEVIKQVDILKDTVRTELENRTEVVKDTVAKVVTAAADTIRTQVEDKARDALSKQKDKVRDAMKGKLDSTITNVLTDTLERQVLDRTKDILGDKAETTIDSLKDKLNDWNPFKKKGGGGE